MQLSHRCYSLKWDKALKLPCHPNTYFCGLDKNKIRFSVSQQTAYLYKQHLTLLPYQQKKFSSVYSSKMKVINNINYNDKNNNNNLSWKWLKSVAVTILHGSYIVHLMLSKHKGQSWSEPEKAGKKPKSSIHPCLGGQVGKETETSKVLQAVDLKADFPLHPPPPQSIT